MEEFVCKTCSAIFEVHRVENCSDDEIVCCPFCMSMEIHNEDSEDEFEHDHDDED